MTDIIIQNISISVIQSKYFNTKNQQDFHLRYDQKLKKLHKQFISKLQQTNSQFEVKQLHPEQNFNPRQL
ncbi:unnamed protein product [Paramecium octaurelia]|uniref:Uncharacterized protein n=1 Tax=Paramecium octaurelia TaxID=43137 RepID=A0A8S1Y9G6_PAROT|nr:unnamed protein product [Paramecium octaurelia]